MRLPPRAKVIPPRTAPISLLLLLIGADLVFVLCHVIYVETAWLSGRSYSLEADGGLPEWFQYMKQLWIAACMTAIFWRTRNVIYVSWAIVFAFLLLDDALQIHEQVGFWLGQRHGLPAVLSLRPDDLGELLFAATVGLATLFLVGVASWRGGGQARIVSRDLLTMIVLLAFLGVVVDALHVIAYLRGSLWAQVLLIVEDGGEMIVVSALTAYVFDVAIHRGQPSFSPWLMISAVVGGLRDSGDAGRSTIGN
jgi:hypothetical protein